MYQIRLCSTDAASRLDPCTGMKLVEKVDTATWLACATELSQGCSSLANTAPRFEQHRSCGPGPDAYVITSTWGGRKPDPCGLLMPDVLMQAFEGQSVPDQNKTLTSERQPLYKPEHRVGPGQYDPDTDRWEKLVYSARERNAIQMQHPLNVPRFIEQVILEVQKQVRYIEQYQSLWVHSECSKE
ncbi:unnamed protein product [Echinostoma caproni]|uniref:Gag_p30 domain-containing protein n=1 Tax=Echinostoma caproni TaxID=27848 RepID=A0A183ALF1_9TREM|nr:unnamed protein product [Echinostoma caproni]